jgi:hypothetical protein
VLDAVSRKYRAFPPAADFVDFWIEQDGKRISPDALSGSRNVVRLPAKRARVVDKSKTAAPTGTNPAPLLLLQKLSAELGNEFLEAIAEACEELFVRKKTVAKWKTDGRKRLYVKIAKEQETRFTKERVA